MEGIVEFVVEGMRPASEQQTVEILMRLPQFAPRVDWTKLFFWLLRGAHKEQVAAEFAWWLLQPIKCDAPWCNCLGLLQRIETRAKSQFKVVFCQFYSGLFVGETILEQIQSAIVSKSGALRQKLALLWQRHWSFRQMRPGSADVKLAFVLMHCWVRQAD
jgi:hypothetical protein